MIIWIIIGIAGILYGINIKCLGSGSGFYMIWIVLGVLAFFMAWAGYMKLWGDVPKIAKRVLMLSIIFGVLVLTVVEGCVLSQFGKKGDNNLDYIIVLGAQVRENGPSAVLKYRLDLASDYLKKNPNTICIVSGGKGANEPFSEAEGMYQYLTEQGIEAERIILEDQSKNTVQNIQYSMKYLDPKNDTVGIVTNDFHVFRGVHIAKKQGIVHAQGMAAESKRFYLPHNMLREFFGIVKDYFKKNL